MTRRRAWSVAPVPVLTRAQRLVVLAQRAAAAVGLARARRLFVADARAGRGVRAGREAHRAARELWLVVAATCRVFARPSGRCLWAAFHARPRRRLAIQGRAGRARRRRAQRRHSDGSFRFDTGHERRCVSLFDGASPSGG